MTTSVPVGYHESSRGDASERVLGRSGRSHVASAPRTVAQCSGLSASCERESRRSGGKVLNRTLTPPVKMLLSGEFGLGDAVKVDAVEGNLVIEPVREPATVG